MDGVVGSKPGSIRTCGSLFKDKEEKVFIFWCPISVNDSNKVQLWAVREAIWFSNILFQGHFLVQFDCSSSIKFVNGDSLAPWKFNFKLNKISEMWKAVDVEFHHFLKCTNDAANCLGKEGVDRAHCMVVLRCSRCFHVTVHSSLYFSSLGTIARWLHLFLLNKTYVSTQKQRKKKRNDRVITTQFQTTGYTKHLALFGLIWSSVIMM